MQKERNDIKMEFHPEFLNLGSSQPTHIERNEKVCLGENIKDVAKL